MKPLLPLLAAFVCLAPVSAQVKVTQGSDRILVDINGQPFTALFIGGETTKPYLHPIRAASGKIVSRVWPMEEKEGEAKDHPHHRGLWFSHGDVNGWDFWANEPSQKGVGLGRGKIQVKRVTGIRSGKKDGSLSATFDWVDGTGKTLLTEARTITFQAHPALRVMDFDIVLTGVVESKFGDTKEGTFAVRLTAPLDGKHSGKMVSSDGKVGEKLVWGKAFPWVDYVGTVEGEQLGVAILDHPSNPKHPTYWHSRDYGLFAANIFGEHDFFNDKSRNGGMTLAPGQSWRFRYRVLVHPGDTQTAGIAKLYDEWVKKSKK